MNKNYDNEPDDIRDLLVAAGRPAELPADDLAVIRQAARAEWQELSAAPVFEGRRRLRPYLALAATLLLAVISVFVYRSMEAPAAEVAVARVEIVRGDARSGSTLSAGNDVRIGDRIETLGSEGEPAHVALGMTSGHSVRLDTRSTIRLASKLRIELERGAIYVDSGPDGASESLEIVTPLGTVREVGTQYEVRVDADSQGAMRVRVREGRVSLDRSGETYPASRGEQLTIGAKGEIERGTVSLTGSEWSWAVAAAPSPDVEGLPIESALEWVARETGLEITYDDPSVGLATAKEVVHGSLAGMTPEEALGVVLESSALTYRIEGERLIVAAPAQR